MSGSEWGSPPHVRGKEPFTILFSCLLGITPACAGKSCAPLLVSDRYEDHPRVCGEKGPQTMKGGHCARITPAYAGGSTCNTVGRQHRGEHPRVCGEKPKVMNLVLVRPGSPPHVRGKVDVLSKIDTLIGITPAYAGKRLKRSRSTVPPVAIVPLFPSVCNKPVVSDGSPAGRDAPLFLPAENAVPASPAYNLRSL